MNPHRSGDVADFYARFTEVEAATLAKVAEAMEVRPVDPRHRAMLERAAGLTPQGTRVLEVGCGTGAIARLLAQDARVREVIAVDSSPLLVSKARQLAAGMPKVRFEVADGTALSFGPSSFDTVVLHRVLSHVPRPAQVLAEAARVLRRGGALSIFDGDFATLTLGKGVHDPLESCLSGFLQAHVHDPWIVGRLTTLAATSGFVGGRLRSFGHVQMDDTEYVVSIVDRGAAALVAEGRIGAYLGEALKAEARRRAQAGVLFGHLAYAGLMARRA
jgi:ubiquinone/menaquinone biosynthesis C-methylase UbiE